IPDQSGDATLVVRATDSGGLSVDDTVVVTVTPIVPPVNDPPVVANAVPDTSVTAGSAPIDNYRDLNTVFTDAEEGGVLMFAIDSNSNPGLVSVVIDADSALDLSFTPNQSGDATLVVRATDSGGLSVDDTFVVTVTSITPPANNPPTVTNAIPDTTITIGAAIDSYRDLHAVFGDAEDEGALVFSVESNSNPESVRGSIKGRNELVLRAKRKTGRATIVIRASDSGALTVCDTVVVTVIAVNDPPTVASAIQDTTVTEGDPPIDNYRDLNDVFVDTEDGGALAFSIESNTNPALVTTVIDADSALDLSFTPDQNGDATIVIRATDSGALWTEDTFVVTVTAVAVLPPATITGLPELATPKRSALYQNLPNPFNPTTTIGFDVARTGKVVLRIYDANGRLVRTIVNSELPQARHEIEWDGRDDGGNTVASGVYFYRLVTRDFRATKKLVLLK
ncbi:MAG: Ig-like domain-containing protein, partial [Candidatus Krumholzibacteria bacterium]|nr:Ig-like domain-containing protein [Candidatus Krumholzibacteria bacterium]